MKTSNFARSWGVSIAGKAPAWFDGPEYKKLAPKYSFFKAYKEGIIGEAEYTDLFKLKVLEPLDVVQTYKELVALQDEDVVLLCWEKPGEFCHRRIVAEWFEDKLGIKVEEV